MLSLVLVNKKNGVNMYKENSSIKNANGKSCEEYLLKACDCCSDHDMETCCDEINKAIGSLKSELKTDCSKEKENTLKECCEELQSCAKVAKDIKQGDVTSEKKLNERLAEG